MSAFEATWEGAKKVVGGDISVTTLMWIINRVAKEETARVAYLDGPQP